MIKLMSAIAATVALCALAAIESADAGQSPQRVQRGQLVVENVPITPPDVRERLRQYVNTRGAGFADFRQDGGILISTRFGNASQIHTVSAPLGARTQLTFFDEPVGGATIRPIRGDSFAFVKDKGGDEYFQGYLFDLDNGETTHFTEDGFRNTGQVWTRDGAKLAYSRASRDSGDFDILIVDPSAPETRRVALKGKGAIAPIDWSPDGNSLLLGEYVSVTKSRRFLLDINSAALTELTPELDVSYGGGVFTADGSAIILTSDEGSDFERLARLDLLSGERSVLSPPNLEWDVQGFDVSKDGKRIAYVVNAGGASELHIADLRGKTLRPLPSPPLPPGIIGNFEFDDSGKRLGLTFTSATASSDAYIYETSSRKLVRWTQSEVGGLDPKSFREPRLEAFPTFDTGAGGPDEITAWIYEPASPGPHPVIVNIHGGPEGQSRPGFSSTIQYWVNELGYAVVLPNRLLKNSRAFSLEA